MQQRIRKSNAKPEHVEEISARVQGKELKAEMDDLLDEIDDVLEENAEAFVASYQQRGGQ